MGLDVLDVIYHTVHNAPGGTAGLASRMGMSVDVLRQKANVNNGQHVFHPKQLMALMYFTNDVTVLQAMADHLGYVVLRATPDQSDGDLVQALARLQSNSAEVVRHSADVLSSLGAARAMEGAGAYVTGNEVRRVEHYVQETHAALGHLLAALRANMRPEPGQE